MTGTLRNVGALLLAAVLGAAFAAGSSVTAPVGGSQASQTQTGASGLVTRALASTRVTLLGGAPGSGAQVIATMSASKLATGGASAEGARYVTLSVAGHGASFAVAGSGGAGGGVQLAVSGVPGSSSASHASLSTVATLLYDAAHGTAAAVLLDRGQGAGAVTFAVYDPAKPAPALRVAGATEAVVVVNGRVTTYRVRAAGTGMRHLVVASGAHRGQQLDAVIG